MSSRMPRSFTAIAGGAFNITPDDGQDLPQLAVGFHANTDGDAHVLLADGDEVTFTVVTGVSYPYAIKKVFSTGTTATLIGLY